MLNVVHLKSGENVFNALTDRNGGFATDRNRDFCGTFAAEPRWHDIS